MIDGQLRESPRRSLPLDGHDHSACGLSCRGEEACSDLGWACQLFAPSGEAMLAADPSTPLYRGPIKIRMRSPLGNR